MSVTLVLMVKHVSPEKLAPMDVVDMENVDGEVFVNAMPSTVVETVRGL